MIQLVHFPAEEDKLGLLLSVQLAFQSFVVVGLLIILDVVIVLTDILSWAPPASFPWLEGSSSDSSDSD